MGRGFIQNVIFFFKEAERKLQRAKEEREERRVK